MKKSMVIGDKPISNINRTKKVMLLDVNGAKNNTGLTIINNLHAVDVLKFRVQRNNNTTGRGTELKSFCLSDNCDGNGTKCSTFEIKPEDKLGSTTRYRNFYTFSIKNIPTIGSGLYAVTLVRKRMNYYSVLASYYFNVVDDRDSGR